MTAGQSVGISASSLGTNAVDRTIGITLNIQIRRRSTGQVVSNTTITMEVSAVGYV
jgi:hypothetical protein